MSGGPAQADLLAAALLAATTVRERAYAPYSGFSVGAAVVADEERIFAGANVENASYGLTACAERIAVWTAVCAGAAAFSLVVIVTDTAQPVSPCGACRQVLAELAPDAAVVMATIDGLRRVSTVRELLPGAFGAADLNQDFPATAQRPRQSL